MSRLSLTPRQDEIFAFVVSSIKNGMPPTRKEIGSKFGIYPNGVQCHLEALQKKGFIRLVPGLTRNILVTAP